jgi:hypothetical protein
VFFRALAAANPPNPAPTITIFVCAISTSILFGRCYESFRRARLSTSIFERQQHARAVRLDFAVIDSHVRFYHLCHT